MHEVVILTEPCFEDVTSTAITSDGGYIYIHNKHGMFKFGTGYGGTLKVLQPNFVILRYQKSDQIGRIMLISKHMFLKCRTHSCFVFVSSPEPKAQGELIVWDSSRRPSVHPSVHTFKHEYL